MNGRPASIDFDNAIGVEADLKQASRAIDEYGIAERDRSTVDFDPSEKTDDAALS